MEKPKFDIKNLHGRFIEAEITDRVLAIHIADLAVNLAQQAGEEVTRPLSRDQLARAVRVNTTERREVMDLLEERWAQLYQDGVFADEWPYREPKQDQPEK